MFLKSTSLALIASANLFWFVYPALGGSNGTDTGHTVLRWQAGARTRAGEPTPYRSDPAIYAKGETPFADFNVQGAYKIIERFESDFGVTANPFWLADEKCQITFFKPQLELAQTAGYYIGSYEVTFAEAPYQNLAQSYLRIEQTITVHLKHSNSEEPALVVTHKCKTGKWRL